MKKVVLCLMAVAAMTLTSCGSKSNENADGVENAEASELNIEQTLDDALTAAENNDEEALAERLTDLQSTIEELQLNGEEEKALQYAETLQKWYETNREKVEKVAKNFNLAEVVDKVTDVTGITEGKFQEVTQEAEEKLNSTVDEQVEAVKEDVQDAANQAKEQAKEKVNEEVNKAKEQAQKAQEEATKKAKEKANEAVNKLFK